MAFSSGRCDIGFSRGVLNRLTGISYSDGTPPVTYSYDAGGQTAFALSRITQITENGNSQAFTYDNLGRITSVMHNIDGTNYQVQYAYNPVNQMTSITYPSGRVVKPDYYSVGFLKQIADIKVLLRNIWEFF
jgi:YD repeat-containing protein